MFLYEWSFFKTLHFPLAVEKKDGDWNGCNRVKGHMAAEWTWVRVAGLFYEHLTHNRKSLIHCFYWRHHTGSKCANVHKIKKWKDTKKRRHPIYIYIFLLIFVIITKRWNSWIIKKKSSVGEVCKDEKWINNASGVLSRGDLVCHVTPVRSVCVCVCCNQCAASVWFWSVFSGGAGYWLLFVYEGQQEQSYVMWAPVACVRGHRRPVAALHQTLAELKVDTPLQLHCKTTKLQCSPAVKRTTIIVQLQ